MKLTISKNANINYLARIVQVDTFHPHPNADKLKLCTVEGYIISTGIVPIKQNIKIAYTNVNTNIMILKFLYTLRFLL